MAAQAEAVTQVEQYVRDRVARTAEPCLLVPGAAKYPILGVAVWKVFAEEREVYVLVIGDCLPNDDEEWALSTRIALQTVRKWLRSRPEGVYFVHEEGATDVIQRVEATALGLSLLQLALNRAGSRLAIEVYP